MAKKKTAKKKLSKKTGGRKPAALKMRKVPTAKASVNKSQAIRDYVAANPEAGPTEISKALSATGVSVSPSFVSLVRNKSGGGSKKRGPKRGGKARAVRSNAASSVSIEDLKAAKRFAEKVGGVDKARETLSALSTILD